MPTDIPYEVNCRRPLDNPTAGGTVQQAHLFATYREARTWMLEQFNDGWSCWMYENGHQTEHLGPVLPEHQ